MFIQRYSLILNYNLKHRVLDVIRKNGSDSCVLKLFLTMDKNQYLSPEMEIINIALQKQILQGSEIDMSVSSSRDGYNAPLGDYDSEWD